MVSGDKWVDFMNRGADKEMRSGSATDARCDTRRRQWHSGITAMTSGCCSVQAESYAVANAHPEVKKTVKYIAPANTEDGIAGTVKGAAACRIK